MFEDAPEWPPLQTQEASGIGKPTAAHSPPLRQGFGSHGVGACAANTDELAEIRMQPGNRLPLPHDFVAVAADCVR